LKIWNKGKTAAKNVSISFPEGNDLVVDSELRDKLPLEILDVHQSVELIAAVHMQTRPKHVINLSWSDGANEPNSKTVHVTL
jgi:hypothetical protein